MSRSLPGRQREGYSGESRQRQRQRPGGVKVDTWHDRVTRCPADNGIASRKSTVFFAHHPSVWFRWLPVNLPESPLWVSPPPLSKNGSEGQAEPIWVIGIVQERGCDTYELQLGDLLGLIELQMARCKLRTASDQLCHPEGRSFLRIQPAQRKAERRERTSMTLLTLLDPAVPEADIHYTD